MSVQVKGSGTIGGLDEGLVVSGIVTSSTQINVGSNIKLGNAGVITATSLDISGSIDVDGHTNLDNVSIAGVTTITANNVIGLNVENSSGSGAQTTIRSKSTVANASNFVRSESSDNKYIGLLKYGTGHSAYGALAAGGGAVYANSSVPITIMSDGSYINFATGGNTERLRIDSSGHISQGGGATPSSTNGNIGLKYGIKSTANNVIIGETTQSGTGYGLHLESRQTGRSGNARIAQIGLRNDASGNGQITFWTSPSGADVTERMNIDSSGNVTKPTSFHILVKRSGNQTGYNASNTTDPVIWNSVVTGDSSPNASSHFNTSTGLFTAPVTGLYFFHTAVNSPNITCQGGWLIINGSRVNYSAFNPNSAQTADATITYHVTAGETVGVKWYHNGQTNGTINANDHHTWWRIALLG